MSNAIEKANWGAGACPTNLATNRLLVEGDRGKEGLSWAEEEMRGKKEDWGIELWRREQEEGQGEIGYFNGIGLSSGLWGRSQSRERERFGGRLREEDWKWCVPTGVGTECSRVVRSHTKQPEPPGGRVVSPQTKLQELGLEVFYYIFQSPGAFPNEEKSSTSPWAWFHIQFINFLNLLYDWYYFKQSTSQ